MVAERYERKAIYSELKDYCYLSKDGDCIEITEWHNGEGIDINIGGTSIEKHIGLTWGELKAIKKLSKKLYEKV